MRIGLLSAAATVALALASANSALAESKTLYVAAYGGSFEQTLRKDIIPAFENKYGVKVDYVAGTEGQSAD
jgi:putative spermidine/putrescine transport system substrate-binding protein